MHHSNLVPLLARLAGTGAILALAACTSHPDFMHVDPLGVELVSSTRYIATRPPGELALAVLFKGDAPFAEIVKDRRFPQFECELRDAAGAERDGRDSGRMYFDGPAMAVDPATGLVPMDDGESYRYRAVVYFGLKAKTTINGPVDIDLLRTDYDHLACRLRGAQMFTTIWMSNELLVPRSALLALAEAAKVAR